MTTPDHERPADPHRTAGRGRPTQRPRVDVRSEVLVDAEAADAWAVVSDFSRNPEWQKGMVRCTWVTEPPLRIGSRYEQRARFLGRDITTLFEVIALTDRGQGVRSIGIDTVEGTFPITVTRTVEPTPHGCRISAHVRGTPGGLMGLASPLMAGMVKRSVDGDYRRLKALLEG